MSGGVCELNSIAFECGDDTFEARNCLCEEGFLGNKTMCQTRGELSRPKYYVSVSGYHNFALLGSPQL